MSRVNDLGGMQGFGPVDPAGEEPPFRTDWEARVFALASVLGRRGLFTSDELRDAIERMPAERYLRASYYERWLAGLCTLLVDKGVVGAAEIEALDE